MDETDAGRQIVNHHLRACLAELLQAGLSHSDAAVHTANTWTILLAVFPSRPQADGPPPLTECDRHCMALLAMQRQPISCYKLCKELECRNIGVWGIATIKRALARLKRLGLVANSRKGPRGYYLPERQSIFLRTIQDDPKQ